MSGGSGGDRIAFLEKDLDDFNYNGFKKERFESTSSYFTDEDENAARKYDFERSHKK